MQFSRSFLSKTVIKTVPSQQQDKREIFTELLWPLFNWPLQLIIQQCWIHGKRQTSQPGDQKVDDLPCLKWNTQI